VAKTFHCSIVTPAAQVFDGPVVYASIPAWDGQLGVAADRVSLVAKLGDGNARIETEDGERHLFLGGGFAEMKDNTLTLLTTETVAPGEVDHEQVRRDLKEAENEVAVGDEAVAGRDRRANRARALLELVEQG